MCLACNLSSTIIVVVYFKLLVVFLILPTTFKHLLMLFTMKRKKLLFIWFRRSFMLITSVFKQVFTIGFGNGMSKKLLKLEWHRFSWKPFWKSQKQYLLFICYVMMNLSVIIKDTLKAFDDFNNKQQKCMEYCFLIYKSMYILKVNSIHYTLK